VISGLVQLFGEVEEFWNSGAIGSHIRVFSDKLVKDAA
jgi:hypothetical protein